MNKDNEQCLYDNYPLSIVLLRLTIMTILMGLGTWLIYQLHFWGMIGYLAFSIIGIYATTFLACRHCYYHGKRCDLGLGLLSGMLFKNGRGNKVFVKSAPKTYPFLLVMVFAPFFGGIVLLLWKFTFISLLIMLGYIASFILLLVTSKRLTCPRCKMQGVCPFCLVPEEKRIKI